MQLTPEQEKELETWLEEWLAVGRATGPVDRTAAELACAEAYQERGLPPPRLFVWARSPREGCQFAGILADLPDAKRFEHSKAAQNYCEEQRDMLPEKDLSKKAYSQLFTGCYGQFDSYWLVLGAYMKHLGQEVEADPWPQLRLAKNCSWWWPFPEIAVLTDRWDELHIDEQGRMHNLRGPAALHQDGWATYAVNGTRVPEEWFTQTLTPQIVLNEPNMERRLAGVTLLGGWNKIVESCPTKVIDKDSDPMVGELISVDLPDSPNTRFVRALCGTGRTVVFQVDQDSKTALEAQAKSYQVPPEMIRQLSLRT